MAKEDALKRRRERRHVNETKNRQIQRMQLNMTTPMDIGLERQDGVDDSDMFDLGEVEGGVERKGIKGGLKFDVDRDEDVSDDDDEDGLNVAKRPAAEESDEDLDSEDEEERKTRRLERSLDVAYDAFQQHKVERDAKHKAKEERRKRDAAEGGEWAGIKAQESDEESDFDDDPAPMPEVDSDSDDDMAVAPAAAEEEDEDEEEDDEDKPATKTAPAPRLSKRAQKALDAADAKRRVKESKLLTKLAPTAPLPGADKGRAANMWFDQPVFKGLKGLDELMKGEASEEEDVSEEEEDDDEETSRVWEEMDEDQEKAEAEALKVRCELRVATMCGPN